MIATHRLLVALALACVGIACAFDPTGITLAGEWYADDGFPACVGDHLSLTQQGDSVFGTADIQSVQPPLTFRVQGTQHDADLLLRFDSPAMCFPATFKARLTAADRFVLTFPGTDLISYITFRRRD
jgi:hypothetical protein